MTRDEWREIAAEAMCPRTWIDAVCSTIIAACVISFAIGFGG